MEEEDKEGVGMLAADCGLLVPGQVVLGKPEEVVV